MNMQSYTPQVSLPPRVFSKSHSTHFICAGSNHETVISMFRAQMKPQGGCCELPECNAASGEKAAFNGSINFCKTLKTYALLLLLFSL